MTGPGACFRDFGPIQRPPLTACRGDLSVASGITLPPLNFRWHPRPHYELISVSMRSATDHPRHGVKWPGLTRRRCCGGGAVVAPGSGGLVWRVVEPDLICLPRRGGCGRGTRSAPRRDIPWRKQRLPVSCSWLPPSAQVMARYRLVVHRHLEDFRRKPRRSAGRHRRRSTAIGYSARRRPGAGIFWSTPRYLPHRVSTPDGWVAGAGGRL